MEFETQTSAPEKRLLEHLSARHENFLWADKASDALNEKGLPTVRWEDWKYSPIRKFVENALWEPKESYKTKVVSSLEIPDNHTIHLHNGVPVAVPAGIVVRTLDSVPVDANVDEADIFDLLNAGYTENCISIDIPDNYSSDIPMMVIHTLDGGLGGWVQSRVMLRLGKNSFVKIGNMQLSVESTESIFHNQVWEIVAEEGAKLDFYRYQKEKGHVHQVCKVNADIHAHADLSFHTVSTGSAFTRNYHRANLLGSGARVTLSGATILGYSEHVDNYIQVMHHAPHCESVQLFKSIVAEQSTSVFNGSIFVDRGAQKTNAYQSSKNILLGHDSNVYAKPRLEIYADDVKCSHGSTTGQMDEDALFYLRARGIKEKSARTLLMEAFMGDVIAMYDFPWMKDLAQQALQKKLSYLL